MTNAISRGARLSRRAVLMGGAAGLAVSSSNFVWAQAQGQNLTIGVRAGADSMDPHFTATGTHAEALKHIFEPLVWSGDRLQLEPCMAESWRQVNPTTWEFKLRRGVKFHDGAEMTAEDVKFSIERMKTLSGPNPTTIYVRRVDTVTIVDPYTIHVTTLGPSPTLANDFIRVFVVSKRAAEGLTPQNANEGFNRGGAGQGAAIGTGPFKLVSWTPREALVLERFDQYWRGASPWARVTRREVPNDPARVAQMRAGQLEIIQRAPAADLPAFERDARMRVLKGDSVYVFNIELDVRERTPQVTARDGSAMAANPLRDVRVREAISLAIDRQTLVDVAMEGLGRVQNQMVTPEIFGYNRDLPPLREDLPRARQLMAAAGFPNGFKIVFNFTNDRLPGDGAVGAAVTQMLARIGLDVQANGAPGAVIFPARTRGDLSMVMSGWGTLTGEAHYTLSSLAHSNDPEKRMGAFNWRGYRNAEIDRLLQAAAIEMNEAERRRQLEQAGALYAADFASLPLCAVSTAWVMLKDRVNLTKTRADEETLAYDIVPATR